MPLTDITPALTALSFNDGIETRTLANSFLCSVQVATDGAGNITQWSIDSGAHLPTTRATRITRSTPADSPESSKETISSEPAPHRQDRATHLR